eukprot:symbB.v1.2.019963.t1/scaffold1632.1/size108648/3
MSWLPEPKMDFECQAVLVLSELYDVMGDHVALQYAGSIAHKKYQLLGSRPRMMPTSQELLTSIHRHYNNSFTDREKQACLNLFLGDNWLHHKILKDDYNPGDWWMEPLQNYKQKMEPLMSKGSQYQVDLSHDLQDWFRQVHKAHKYTYFEKLLANVEATFTFVQVNTGQRPLRVTGVYKNRKMMKAKNKEETSTECLQSFPSPLSPKVKEAYRAYADSHLNQLIRGTQFDESVLRPTFQPLSLDTEEEHRLPENTKKQGVKSNPLLQSQKARALFKDMRSLLDKFYEKQKVSSKSRIADPQEQKLSAKLRRMREKTMNTQMNQDPKHARQRARIKPTSRACSCSWKLCAAQIAVPIKKVPKSVEPWCIKCSWEANSPESLQILRFLFPSGGESTSCIRSYQGKIWSKDGQDLSTPQPPCREAD